MMTIVIITVISIVVMDFAFTLRFDRRAFRGFAEGVQADYILKSSINLARILLELPKLPGIKEDWLGEPWSLIAAAESLPVSGIVGTPRLMIVDEDGKIEINSIVSRTMRATAQGSAGAAPSELFYMEALRKLFQQQGFQRENFDPKLARTIGNRGFNSGDQVAVIHDWIDTDNTAFRTATFDGSGIESQRDKSIFYNRPLKSLEELLLVPGMTRERIARIAPFVRVTTTSGFGSNRINVNTAPVEVLLALGLNDIQVADLVKQRLNLPVTQDILNILTSSNPSSASYLKVTSSRFSAIASVEMPNSTRWARSIISIQSAQPRKTQILSSELY